MDRGLGEQPFVSTVSIWLICLMFERRKWHGFKNKTLYRQLLEVFFGALLRFRYHLYRNNAPHRGGGFIGYGSEVPAPPIRRKMKHNMSKAEKQQFYSQKVQKDGTKIEDIPSEFRTIEVYVLALGNVENLAEKRHVLCSFWKNSAYCIYPGCLRQPVFLFHKIQHIKNAIKQHKERKKNNGKNG